MKRRLSLKIESAFPSMQKFQISYDRGLQESYTNFCVLSIVNGDSFLLPSKNCVKKGKWVDWFFKTSVGETNY